MPVRFGVPGQVGVKQIESDAPDLRLPDLDTHLTTGEIDIDRERLTVGPSHRLNREGVKISGRVAFHLPAVGVQRLPEITTLIQKSDSGKRQAEIRGGFQVVTGKNSETARIDRQAFRDPELSGEVADLKVGSELIGVVAAPPATVGHIALKVSVYRVKLGRKRTVVLKFRQPCLRYQTEQAGRVVLRGAPEFRVNSLK